MKKKLFLGLFVISLILTMFSASHGAEVIKLTFSSFLPPTYSIAGLEASFAMK
jgi:hypothetical protein